MSIDAKIVEQIQLPSKGMIYEEEINPNVTLGSMKTKHEMLRLSAHTGNKVMADIIDDCIQGDLGISAYDLCLGDYQYLLYKLRIVSLGPDYQMSGFCPYCTSENFIKVNLDEFPVNYYEDDMAGMFNIELPVTKKQIQLTLQTPRMLDTIAQDVEESRRKKRDNTDTTLLYTILHSIVKIDGEPANPFALEKTILDLPLKDTNFLRNKITEINTKIGLDLDVQTKCTYCEKHFKTPFRINGTFFGPEN